MSRYLLLLLLNIPFILLAVLGAVTKYKLRRLAKRRLIIQIIIWAAILFALMSAESIYVWLFTHQLTQTEPLSLFDVMQITAIVIIFYIANSSRSKIELLEKRIKDLHQEISIKLSNKK